MRRLAWGLVAVALVLVGLRIVYPETARAAPRTDLPRAVDAVELPTKVSLYGDSLSYQARSAFEARMARLAPGDLTVSARPGAALCDDRAAILADLLGNRPQVLVLEFSGNSFTPCMLDHAGALLQIGSAAWRARYLDDLRAVVKAAGVTDTTVVWATAPPVRHLPNPVNYPRLLTAGARKIASTHDWLRIDDTGAALTTDDGAFQRDLRCKPDERALCVDDRIAVRAADGLHFDCNGTADRYGGCLGYSAGGRRFGEALANAAVGAGGSL